MGEVERYARHLVLREIGGPGQQAGQGRAGPVVGAGGLGSPAALYLAAAGVGTIGLVDPDTVSLSNLQRQVLFDTEDVGRSKVEAADPASGRPESACGYRDRIRDGAGHRQRRRHRRRLRPRARRHRRFRHPLRRQRRLLAHRKPLVSGALGRWTGQVGVFEGRPCYRCLVPEIPPDAETCALVGVVGALAGVIGSMMALEAVKLITGAGEPSGKLLIYDALAAETRTVRIGADPRCAACGA
jgi:molybdopterin/thiamine biosynthesis adenylyltransferase